jgi:hypothetical protein
MQSYMSPQLVRVVIIILFLTYTLQDLVKDAGREGSLSTRNGNL